jgi:rubrerythrin
MTKRWLVRGTVIMTILCMGAAGVAKAADKAAAPKPSPKDALMSAFASESAAKARCEAFAAVADEEGYASVAGLFRAMAKSEALHADHHQAMLKKLGVEVAPAPEKPSAKSTKENLDAAIKAAGTEKNTLYPDLLKQVEGDKDTGAPMTFKGAIACADANIKLCEQALKELDAWKAAGKVFLVCQVCGFVTPDQKTEKCPICAAPRTKFEPVK